LQTTAVKRRPNEVENFARKYATEWRQAFLSQKKVNYQFVDHTLDL